MRTSFLASSKRCAINAEPTARFNSARRRFVLSKNSLIALAGLLLLAACDPPKDEWPNAALATRLTESPEKARDWLSNTTVHSFGGGHGNQYEYLAANGKTALVYPGNLAPLKGEWQISGSGREVSRICFRYGANSYNPVTGQSGNAWECTKLWNYLYHQAIEIIPGDAFGANGIRRFKSPFPAWSDNVPIRDAVAFTGKRPPTTQDRSMYAGL